jgi:Copine
MKNYYTLVILMAGVIDDFQDALNELMRASNLPVSVLIIKVGGN